MKNIYLLRYFLPLIFIGCATKKNENSLGENVPPNLQELVFEHTKMFPNDTELAFAIIENGNANYYGVKKKFDSLLPIENSESAFEIGSISKVFTSVLLADMVLDGTVELKSDINSYYNFKFNRDSRISFESLANHTSGLPRMPSNFNLDIDNPDPFGSYTEKDLMSYLENDLELESQEFPSYNYSNLGVGLLGFTLSKIEQESLNDLYKDRIFHKYNMGNSTIGSQNLKTRLVSGLDRNGNPIPNWSFGPLGGAGAIISTTEDLSKFAIAQFNEDKVLNLTRTKTHSISANREIGLGWESIPKEGDTWYWHNGGTGGYTSCMIVSPSKKNAVIILSNVSATSGPMDHIDKLTFQIMQTL